MELFVTALKQLDGFVLAQHFGSFYMVIPSGYEVCPFFASASGRDCWPLDIFHFGSGPLSRGCVVGGSMSSDECCSDDGVHVSSDIGATFDWVCDLGMLKGSLGDCVTSSSECYV